MKAQATKLPKTDEVQEKWYVVDAEGQILGRVAARVASLVRGKRSASYTPHLNPKIHVVVVNADKAVLTGGKEDKKIYYHHSGWRTGVKTTTPNKLAEKKPTEVMRLAIHGMLPKNRLGRALNRNVRIYAGAEHPHAAQQPEALVLKTRQVRTAG